MAREMYTVRRNAQGHAEAIERDGYAVLLLAIRLELVAKKHGIDP